MFFIVLYALYIFWFQKNTYARLHVLVLIDTIFFSIGIVSCFILSKSWMLSIKYLFLWFFVFLCGAINISLVSSAIYKTKKEML